MRTRSNLESANGKPKPDNKKVEHDFLAVGIGASAGGKRAGELLRGTEKHFRTLFELGPVAMFSCDLAGVVQDYNRRAAEIWGREPKRGDPSEKYCGSFNLYHPDGRLLPHDESPIVEVLRAGVAVGGVEVFIERPDGTRVPVIVNFEPLIDEHGAVTGAITSFLDITERKHAEETLRASEELNTAIISSLSAQIAVLDGDGNITAVNQAWREFAKENNGKVDRTGIGINYLQICRNSAGRFAENASEAMTGIAAVLTGKLPFFSLEYPCHSPNVRRWFLLNVTPLRNERGGGVVSHQNITERKRAEEELRESEEFKRSIIDSSPDCIKVLDLDGNLLSMEAGQELLCIDDITPFLNKSWTEFWEGADREAAQAAVDAAAAGGNGNFVGFFRNMRGEPKWWNVAISPILDADGNPVRLLAVSRDVTEQTEADEDLRKHEWRLRYATESAQLTFVEIDLIRGGALTPENFAAVMGYPPPAGQEEDASVGSRVLLEHVVPDDRPRVEAALREFFDGKSVGKIDYRVLGDDQIERWIETRWSMELSPDGKPLKSFATNLDITERKLAEKALRSSEELGRLALDAAELGTFNIDPATNTLKADERFHAIFGIADEQIDYEQAFAIVHPDDRDRQRIEVAAAIRPDNPVPYNTEYRVIHPDGSIHWVSAKARAHFGQNGLVRKLLSFDGTVADITERKQLEANLAFLADIGQDLARITTVEETMRTVGAKMGAYLDLSLCTFIEINEAEDHATVNYEWKREDVPSGIGVHRISDFMTEEFQTAGRAGETFIIRDAGTDPRTTAESFAAFKIGSMVTVPIIRDGAWQFLMCVYRSDAHNWREDEIALTQELTVRVWTRLESARALTALHKSEQLIRSIYDGAQEYIGLLTPDGTVLEANRAALEFGPSEINEVIGLPFWETIWFKHTQGAPQLVREAMAIAAGGEFVRRELSLFKPSGETMTFDFSLYPIRDEQGEVIFIVPEGRDITTRKQAEENLRKSEENFRTLADNISQLAWTTDENGWIFWYNSRWFDYTGTTLDEMQGWGWQKVHHPDEIERVVEKFKRHIASGEVWEDTFPLRSKTGEYRWFLSRARPIRDENGNIVRWFGTNTDIEDVRQAEIAVLKSEENFRALAEASPGLIWRLDADGNTTYVNRRYRRFFGKTTAEVLGKGWLPLVHPDDAAGYNAALSTARRNRESFRAGFRVQDKVGSWAWLESHALPISDANGEYAGHIGISLDLTDRKLIEEELRLSRMDLETRVAERTAELADALKSLKAVSAERLRGEKERVRLLGQILTTQENERRRISRDMHDHFGQQLTALRLHLELLEDMCDEEALCDKVNETKAIAKQLDSDVSFLVWELRPTALDDLGLTEALAHYVEKWAAQFEIPAEFRVGNLEGTKLSGEIETCLYRIAQEALNNVYKYAEAKQVSVLLEKREREIVMIVEDNGKGFALGKKTNRRKGFGLIGMRERSALVGGSVEIESTLGHGTTIFVRIPVKTGTN